MAFLVDTGILLRLLERGDPQHPLIRQALRQLRQHGERQVAAPQNAAEFLMTAHGLSHLVTLNPADFARYPTVTAMTPSEVIAAFP